MPSPRAAPNQETGQPRRPIQIPEGSQSGETMRSSQAAVHASTRLAELNATAEAFVPHQAPQLSQTRAGGITPSTVSGVQHEEAGAC